MNNLKIDIKKLAEGQAALRSQRKTINFVGERVLNAGQAFFQHKANRHQLRLLYTIQQLLKGKTLEQIEPKSKGDKLPLSVYQLKLDLLMRQYAPVTHSD